LFQRARSFVHLISCTAVNTHWAGEIVWNESHIVLVFTNTDLKLFFPSLFPFVPMTINNAKTDDLNGDMLDFKFKLLFFALLHVRLCKTFYFDINPGLSIHFLS